MPVPISGFCSMKRLGVFQLILHGILVHRRLQERRIDILFCNLILGLKRLSLLPGYYVSQQVGDPLHQCLFQVLLNLAYMESIPVDGVPKRCSLDV